jgi:methylglyoxal synthase
MYIAIIAANNKKELMAQFCIAYKGILARHNLLATQVTGKYVKDATGLDMETFLAGVAGTEQVASRISCDEIDLVFYFRDTDPENSGGEAEEGLLRLCDIHNVPVATNIATAEALILALDSGALDWREVVNPNSRFNRK